MVLFATGRTPSTHDMGLEDIGVALGRRPNPAHAISPAEND